MRDETTTGTPYFRGTHTISTGLTVNILFILLLLCGLTLAQTPKNVIQTMPGNKLVGPLHVPSGGTLTIDAGATITNNGTASGFSVSSVAWSAITGTPTTLAGYGVTDVIANSAVLNAPDDTTALIVTGGTITTGNTTPFISVTGTWNTGPGTAPTAIFANITNVSSSAFSLLVDIQRGGDSMFNVSKTGVVYADQYFWSELGSIQLGTYTLNLNHGITLDSDGTGQRTLNIAAGGTLGSAAFLAAASANTVSTVVQRNSSGNFSAGIITAALTGNASTATALATGRTVSITGDIVYTSPSFDGSGNVTAAGTLATVNSNVGSFTNASVTVNAKGLVTAASSGTAVAPGGSSGQAQYNSSGAFAGYTGPTITDGVLKGLIVTGPTEGSVNVLGDYGALKLMHEVARIYFQDRAGSVNYVDIGLDGSNNYTIKTNGVLRVTITASGGIIFAALPTSDPGVSGQLYKTAGAVMQSP